MKLYEGRAFVEGHWRPWHPIVKEVYDNRQKWPREDYQVQVREVGVRNGELIRWVLDGGAVDVLNSGNIWVRLEGDRAIEWLVNNPDWKYQRVSVAEVPLSPKSPEVMAERDRCAAVCRNLNEATHGFERGPDCARAILGDWETIAQEINARREHA